MTALPLSNRTAQTAGVVVGDLALAVAVGVAAYALSCWLVPPAAVPLSFGEQWQRMSIDPTALFGQFPHRILAPLLAWLCGLGGAHYLDFMAGVHVALLASAFFVCRHRGGAVVDGVLVALALAVTAPTQMYKEHWVGYADPLCYTLFLWSMVATRRPVVFWLLFLANLFNHELAGFLLPWLWFLRRRADARRRLDLLCIAGVLAAYATFYLFVKSRMQQTYSVDYFLEHPLFPGGTLAVVLLAAVHCVVTYGPVLAVLAWHQHLRGVGTERWHLWLVVLGILAIFGIAFDWQRHSNLIVLPLVVAATTVLRGGWRSRAIFAGLILLSAALFAVPTWRPWTASAWPTSAMSNFTLLVDTKVVLILRPDPIDFGFGPLSATLQNWLPAVWPWLWPVLAIGVVIWVAGCLLARWLDVERAPAPAPASIPA